MKTRFNNANEAYEAVLDEILQEGVDFGDTKAIFNCGFYIDNPSDKAITNAERKWNQKYAAAEWAWYLSGDPSINKLGELYEEAGELAQALLKDDQPEVIDAIGDMVVVLTNLAHQRGVSIEQCINDAYKVISKRKGKMINGTFVKETL